MDNATLGSVIGSLQLGKVDNVTAHGSSSDEAAVGEVGELVAVDIGALLLLTAPVGRGGPGAVECAVQVSAHDVTVVLDRSINHGTLGPRDTGVGNKHVQAAIKVLDNGIGGLLNGLGIGDLDLVGLGCSKSIDCQPLVVQPIKASLLTLNTVLLGNLRCALNGLWVRIVPQGNVGTGFSQAVRDGKSNTRAGTGHNGSLALEGEHVHQAGVLGGNGVVVDEESILNWASSHGWSTTGRRLSDWNSVKGEWRHLDGRCL